MLTKALAFLKSMFSEPDGTASSSRVLAGSGVSAMLFCIVYATFKNGNLPENLGDAALVLGACFTGYGVNQFRAAMKDHDESK